MLMHNKLILVLTYISLYLGTSLPVAAQNFKDRDWNTALYSNCGFPKAVEEKKNVKWVKVNSDQKLLFSLHPGQIGKCSTDNMARHSAPYWERAEIRQRGSMKIGEAYSIKFNATFLEGFDGRQETFFQIHGWNDNCRAYPPVMMHFSSGTLNIWALRGVKKNAGSEWLSSSQGSHQSVQTKSVRIESLRGKETPFEIIFDTKNGGLLSVLVNGRYVVKSTKVEYSPCAKPHMKMGIYRPGGKGSKKSSILFDDVTINRIE